MLYLIISNWKQHAVYLFSAVVATFTKSECQSSSSDCLYQPEDSQDMFSVKLDVTHSPHSEYICHPDSSFPQLQVQGCMVSNKEDTESKKAIKASSRYVSHVQTNFNMYLKFSFFSLFLGISFTIFHNKFLAMHTMINAIQLPLHAMRLFVTVKFIWFSAAFIWRLFVI